MKVEIKNPEIKEEDTSEKKISEPINIPEVKDSQMVSAFSLSGLKARKTLKESAVAQNKKPAGDFPTEPFTETDMLLQWNKFAQKLEDRGEMIMHSLMLINDPKLEGTTVYHELPNEGTKIEFERTKNEILGYLRGMLHNHDINIEVVVNESIENKRAFTPEDKYNRLKSINPNLETLKKLFDLDI